MMLCPLPLVLLCLKKMTTASCVERKRCDVRRFVEIAAPAKINLFLEVLGKRPDGFHELETLMVAVNWFDRLRFVIRDDDHIRLQLLNIRPSQAQLPLDDRNLIIRALKLLRENSSHNSLPGCDALLYKELPSEAGLGGASSDAAAALLAGNLLWNLNFSISKLHDLAARLGSDVPFFLYGGASVCRGRGEKIERLSGQGNIPVVIVKPQTGLSTKDVFSHVQFLQNVRSMEPLKRGFMEGCLEQTGKQLFNRLSEPAVKLNPQILEIAEQFTESNATGHQMSGSGSSYFGLFRSGRAARQAGRLLSQRFPQSRVHIGHTLGTASPCLSISRSRLGSETAMEVQLGNN